MTIKEYMLQKNSAICLEIINKSREKFDEPDNDPEGEVVKNDEPVTQFFIPY